MVGFTKSLRQWYQKKEMALFIANGGIIRLRQKIPGFM